MTNTPREITVIRIRSVQIIVKQLMALKCQFKIVTAEGDEFGELEIAPPTKKRARKPRTHAAGVVRDALLPYVAGLEPGDVVTVALDDLPNGFMSIQGLQSALTGMCHHMWGKGTYTSQRNSDPKTGEPVSITILRLL